MSADGSRIAWILVLTTVALTAVVVQAVWADARAMEIACSEGGRPCAPREPCDVRDAGTF